MEVHPKPGLQGMKENWQSDVIAAISVSLVALPLALGIALASGVPPMAGIISAIIGGVVTTFFRGSHVAVNGPAAGLITVILASIAALDFGDGQTLNYVLAAIVVSGAIQVLLGLLKLGRFAEIFHSSVIHGILAAIGIIIFSKQIHIALGTTTEATSVIDTLIDAARQIPNINPYVGIISLLGLILLVYQSKINYRLFHIIPAPLWVLVISIPFVYAFNFFDAREVILFSNSYNIGPELLINIPDNILDAIAHPNFNKINTLPFWTSVLSITMIASVESLASSKAVDKLDPYRRKTDLNKDLIGIGISTMVSGALGGLPIITVIVRSTVNVHNHAKTKWSNLYHGIILLAIVFLLTPVIQQVPLCALAILLVYTGFKLASPKVFRHVYDQGIEQLIFFLGTLVITLTTDLLIGIFGGLLLALIVHFLLAKVSIRVFFQMIFNSGTELIQSGTGAFSLKVKGIANFLGTTKIERLLNQITPGSKVIIDLSSARLVDFSIMENLYEFQRSHGLNGGIVEISGMDRHMSSTNHKLALKILTADKYKVTNRELVLKSIAQENDWSYQYAPDEAIQFFETFNFFRSRPIEKLSHCITGSFEDATWEITDVLFEEGAFLAYEEYKTTLGIVKMPHPIPRFTIEEKGFLSKFIDLSHHKDIDYKIYDEFPDEFIVKVENKHEIDTFFSEEFKQFISQSNIHHLESNGEAILIFTDKFRLAKTRETLEIIAFTEDLRKVLT